MIKKLSSKTVYSNNWMSVTEDEVEFTNHHKGIYGVVKKNDFVVVIPFEDMHFYMVKQYRYPIGRDSWEFPQGTDEHDPDIDPTDLARLELKEETGLKAADFADLGYFHQAPGLCKQGFHIFVAKDLTQGEQELEQTEVGLEVKKISVTDFEHMALNGDIIDAPTLSAYAILKLKNLL